MQNQALRWMLIGIAIAGVAAIAMVALILMMGGRDTPPPTAAEANEASSAERLPSQEVALPLAASSNESTAAAASTKSSFVILQIGDSHTAADIFTGEVRDRLQASFGKGGLFLPPGIPRAGVQSAELAINASDAWSYNAMASTDEPDHFWLSGYIATATSADVTITYNAPRPHAFDSIDVSFLKSANGGRAEILLDGELVDTVVLDGRPGEPLIRRLLPASGASGSFTTLAIRTSSAGRVDFSGVFIDQRQSGLSYLSVGFPGARVSVLNRMAPENLADDMSRLNPDMVVLAFGTNEGFDDNLDIAVYRRTLGSIVAALQKDRPDLRIVLIGPPPGARQQSNCGDIGNACGSAPSGGSCWAQPPKLAAVREAEMAVATETGAIFWDWGSVLPSACDVEQGRLGDPALMGPDRVHLTGRGYRESADAFARMLEPIIARAVRGE